MTGQGNYSIQLDPETKMHCTLYLLKNVQNTAEVKKKVISGDLACCLLKPTCIVDPFQIVIAANKAAINESCNQLITRNKSTEILFYLSMTTSISKSLSDFGISDNDTNILVVAIHKKDEQESISKMIIDNINGEIISIEELKELNNLELTQKYYKIDKEELIICNCTDSIISRIACKDFSSLKS
ncbi:hypothetical protein M0802_001732 [Mischocyttarus mexicanus]|nr:hypothetical protein M0802_001732 [Mischocyttarus mexicanus]